MSQGQKYDECGGYRWHEGKCEWKYENGEQQIYKTTEKTINGRNTKRKERIQLQKVNIVTLDLGGVKHCTTDRTLKTERNILLSARKWGNGWFVDKGG